MYKTISAIDPVFNENYTAIGVASSNEYVPYLSVYLLSIIENANQNEKYDIVIFENNISEYNKEILLRSFKTDNISLRFYNINTSFFDEEFYKKAERYKSISFAILLIPEIFKNYKRVLFTDCDLIFKADVAELLNIDLQGYQACAVRDLVMDTLTNLTNSDWKDYCLNELKLNDTNQYFNSGVMVFDIEKLDKNNFTQKTFEIAKHPTRIFIQGILNKYFCGNIKYMDNEWNVDIIDIYNNKHFSYMPQKAKEKYLTSIRQPKVLHWAGVSKPWDNIHEIYAYYWWELARKSPYYEIIIERKRNLEIQKKIDLLDKKFDNLLQKELSIQEIKYNKLLERHSKMVTKFDEELTALANYRKNVLSYWKYKFLSRIILGKKREDYILKKKFYKNKIYIVKQLREE